ncbi:MAG: hypothetical protein SNJ29_10225 [Rikenellaceae bacterium]
MKTEFEKIETLRGEINERKEKIKESIFNIVKLYGDVVECEGKSYKATENIDVNCNIIAFNIVDDELIVKTDFDGEPFDLGLDSFNTVVMSDILMLMIADNRRKLHYRIDNLKESYMAENDTEPLYAGCTVMYLDDGSTLDVTIKFSCDSENDEEDSDIFYYCNSVNDLKYLTDAGCNDFMITSIDRLWR